MSDSPYDSGDTSIIAYTKAERDKQQKANPNIMFIIARSKNRNIVVYEGKTSQDKKSLDASQPVDVYWLDVEPSYQEANRKSGITSDRSELNFIEKSMAYGITCTMDAKDNTQAKLKLVSISDRMFDVILDPATGVVSAFSTVNGVPCKITFVYVKSVERTFLPPKCIYVDLVGDAVDGSGEQRERIEPS